MSWKFKARRVDRSFGNADLFSLSRTKAWRINSGFVYTNLFTIAGLETRSIFTLSHVYLSLTVVAARNFD